MEGLSSSDVALLENANKSDGGYMSFLWIFALLILAGGGFGGMLGGNRQSDAQIASNQEILFGQQFQNILSSVNKIGDGISSLGYSQLQTMSGMQLENQKSIDAVRYDMSNFASQINSNIDNKFASLEKNQLQQTIQAQNEKINQLQLQSALCGVVRYPTSSTYALPSPSCGCNSAI